MREFALSEVKAKRKEIEGERKGEVPADLLAHLEKSPHSTHKGDPYTLPEFLQTREDIDRINPGSDCVPGGRLGFPHRCAA